MSESDLDKVQDAPSFAVLIRVSIDNFTGEPPTKEQLDNMSRTLAEAWTAQIMTEKSIVTYEAIAVDSYMVLESGQEMPNGTTHLG